MALLISACGPAPHTVTISDVAVVGSADATSYSVYGAIHASGPDTLVGLGVENGEGSLHIMSTANGLMKMEAVTALPVVDGELLLASGRIHGMLEALDGPLAPGDSVSLRFDFVYSGPVELWAPVMSPTEYVTGAEHH